VVRVLPWGLDRVIAPNLLGFAVINGFTFTVDLTLLTALHDAALPQWLAVTISYLTAFALSFVLNRTFNFRSHAPVRGQVGRYVLVVAMNYFALILGVSTGLYQLGMEYHLARILAGACEAVFMYCAMRWFVFGSAPETAEKLPDHGAGVELVADGADE
jgi:putative flippase GtrA